MFLPNKSDKCSQQTDTVDFSTLKMYSFNRKSNTTEFFKQMSQAFAINKQKKSHQYTAADVTEI